MRPPGEREIPWNPDDLPDGVRGTQSVGTEEEQEASLFSAARIRAQQYGLNVLEARRNRGGRNRGGRNRGGRNRGGRTARGRGSLRRLNALRIGAAIRGALPTPSSPSVSSVSSVSGSESEVVPLVDFSAMTVVQAANVGESMGVGRAASSIPPMLRSLRRSRNYGAVDGRPPLVRQHGIRGGGSSVVFGAMTVAQAPSDGDRRADHVSSGVVATAAVSPRRGGPR